MPTKKNKINLFTIGFTQKTAQDFFQLLINNKVQKLIDVRLNNVSQLAGFTKKKDLEYFLAAIADIQYEHNLDLAPNQEILSAYKKVHKDWSIYEQQFIKLITQRQIATKLSLSSLANSCLLCSESLPLHCHRRLVAEYLQLHWGDIKIIHL